MTEKFMKYTVKKFKYKKSQLICVVDLETTLPVMSPLLWLSLNLKYRAINTQDSLMRSVSFFYEYIFQKFDVSVEKLFQEKELRLLVEQLEGFSAWLESGRIGINISHIGNIQSAIQPQTHDRHIHNVCNYIGFLNERYNSLRYMSNVGHSEVRKACISLSCSLLDARQRLCHTKSKLAQYKAIAANSTNLNQTNDYRSFDVNELKAILAIIQPSTKNNSNPLYPWKSAKCQLRNYLIFVLMKDYGLRKGEILLLTTHSFKPTMNGDYALVVTTLDDKDDPRLIKPKIKTGYSHRTLLISEEHYELLSFYVSEVRNKPALPDSTFLFINNQGAPLSTRYPNTLCKDIYKAVKNHFSEFLDKDKIDYLLKISPHQFRHTWAVITLSYLIERENFDMEKAKDSLREMGGWSPISNMPTHYARRYIAERANFANLKRIGTKYNFTAVQAEEEWN